MANAMIEIESDSFGGMGGRALSENMLMFGCL